MEIWSWIRIDRNLTIWEGKKPQSGTLNVYNVAPRPINRKCGPLLHSANYKTPLFSLLRFVYDKGSGPQRDPQNGDFIGSISCNSL